MNATLRNKIDSYSGTIPEYYDQYLDSLLLKPYAIKMAGEIEKLGPESILELSAGTGILTEALIDQMPVTTKMLVTDINPEMMDLAKSKLWSYQNISWQLADAMNLPYSDNTFDAVLSQFGVMFYQNRHQVYRKIKEILKPGGTFIFNTWGSIHDNSIIELTERVLKRVFPFDTPNFLHIPFGYHRYEQIIPDLSIAGFSTFTINTVKQTGYATSAVEAATGLLQGTPLCTEIIERDPERLHLVIEELSKSIEKHYGKYDINVPLLALEIQAFKS